MGPGPLTSCVHPLSCPFPVGILLHLLLPRLGGPGGRGGLPFSWEQGAPGAGITSFLPSGPQPLRAGLVGLPSSQPLQGGGGEGGDGGDGKVCSPPSPSSPSVTLPSTWVAHRLCSCLLPSPCAPLWKLCFRGPKGTRCFHWVGAPPRPPSIPPHCLPLPAVSCPAPPVAQRGCLSPHSPGALQPSRFGGPGTRPLPPPA